MNTILERCPLFEGIPAEELGTLIELLGGTRRRYPGGGLLLQADDVVTEMGILLEGEARAVMRFAGGKELLLNRLLPPDLFADILAVGRDAQSPVSIEATVPSTVLWLPSRHLLEGVLPAPAQQRILQNLTGILSQRYFAMQRRLLCLTQPTLRDKIRFYLEQEECAQHTKKLVLPLDRAGMASYLGAERSALCRELSAMRRDGLIEYRKNVFTLLSNC